MEIIRLTPADRELIIRLRMDYLKLDDSQDRDADWQAIARQMAAYILRHMANGDFVALVAKERAEIASAAFLALSELPPGPAFPQGRVVTLLNVLTYPPYRRRGFGSAVVTAALDEARRMGASSVRLSSTADGRPLYQKLGFRPSPYAAMQYDLSPPHNL